MNRRMNRMAIAIVALGLVAAGCSEKAKTPAQGPTPSGGFKTIVSGTITIGTDMPYAPFESLDAQGDPVGFDVELFEEVAERLDYKTKWNNAVFDTIFLGLGPKWDVVASAVTAYAPAGSSAAKTVADRLKIVIFGKPYYSSLQSLAVNTARTPEIKTTADLKSGDRVAVQDGTTGAFYAKENLESKGITLVGFEKAPDMFLALEAGRVKGVVNDLPVSLEAVKDKTDLKVVQQIETGEQYAFAFAKDQGAFRDAVNAQLDAIFQDGTYARIFKKYFPDQELPSYASGGATPTPTTS
jgi:polar amino acid transport system substrate-binding protein